MSEKIISIQDYPAVEIYGPNDVHLNHIKNFFPHLKFVVRGELIKVIGNEKDILRFEDRFNLLLFHYDKFGKLSSSDIEQLLESDKQHEDIIKKGEEGVLVHGRHGLLIRARTPNQERMVDSCKLHDLVFAIGPAGTGKTYTAVALAVRALKNREVKRIILTRPAVEAGENLGFLPGDLKDKLDPYLQPLYDALRDMIPTQKLLGYMEDGIIEIAPLAFMRGRTLDNAFAILDEGQNATKAQLKMFLTRMGQNAKFMVTGDITQIDLPKNQPSGLIHAMEILNGLKGVEFIMLDSRDIVRHRLVSRIIKAYSDQNNK